MPMECRPVGWTVLVEELKRENATNLIIPDSAKGLTLVKHVVRAVGDPRITTDGREIPIPVKVGDEIRWNAEGGPRTVTGIDPQFFGGRTFFILDCDWIKGVFSGEAEPMPPKIVTGKQILVH